MRIITIKINIEVRDYVDVDTYNREEWSLKNISISSLRGRRVVGSFFFFLSGSKLGPYVFTIDIWNLNIEMSLKIIYRICTWFEDELSEMQTTDWWTVYLTLQANFSIIFRSSPIFFRSPPRTFCGHITFVSFFCLGFALDFVRTEEPKGSKWGQREQKIGDELNSVDDFACIVR